eukprot:g33238.t1
MPLTSSNFGLEVCCCVLACIQSKARAGEHTEVTTEQLGLTSKEPYLVASRLLEAFESSAFKRFDRIAARLRSGEVSTSELESAAREIPGVGSFTASCVSEVASCYLGDYHEAAIASDVLDPVADPRVCVGTNSSLFLEFARQSPEDYTATINRLTQTVGNTYGLRDPGPRPSAGLKMGLPVAGAQSAHVVVDASGQERCFAPTPQAAGPVALSGHRAEAGARLQGTATEEPTFDGDRGRGSIVTG